MPRLLPDNIVIITVAQTGALVNKEINPNIPEQPHEIVESAYVEPIFGPNEKRRRLGNATGQGHRTQILVDLVST